MNFDQLAANMTPDIYSRLREAIELGRWATGQKLTVEQKNLSLEAVIKYEISNDMPAELRTGYIASQCKSEAEKIPTVTVNEESSS